MMLYFSLFMQGRIGLKFDIFELMFNEILVMHIHNSHLVYNFYVQAIKLFLQLLHVLCDFWFCYFYTDSMIERKLINVLFNFVNGSC